jgi:hypothetical protein
MRPLERRDLSLRLIRANLEKDNFVIFWQFGQQTQDHARLARTCHGRYCISRDEFSR